jgi:hypothetical protein
MIYLVWSREDVAAKPPAPRYCGIVVGESEADAMRKLATEHGRAAIAWYSTDRWPDAFAQYTLTLHDGITQHEPAPNCPCKSCEEWRQVECGHWTVKTYGSGIRPRGVCSDCNAEVEHMTRSVQIVTDSGSVVVHCKLTGDPSDPVEFVVPGIPRSLYVTQVADLVSVATDLITDAAQSS